MKKLYTGFPVDNPKLKGEDTIWLPMLNVRLGVGFNKKIPMFPAVVDSGSNYCIFKADIASFLGIDVTQGIEDSMGGVVAGIMEPIYYHRLKLIVENNWIVDVTVGFMKKLAVTGILGRKGFFDNFMVTFDQTVIPSTVEIARIERSKPN